jgi:hypothetical protein
MEEVAEAAIQAEDRRERIFREKEGGRERIFDEVSRAKEKGGSCPQTKPDPGRLGDRLWALPSVPAVAVPRTEAGSTHSVSVVETPVCTVPVTSAWTWTPCV